MKTKKQTSDFLHIGSKLMLWYADYGRELPFRNTKDPYKIWISEIVFQQTRIAQGLNHYQDFVGRFPNVEILAKANIDEVLLYWKGLGYYSRALNIHKAAVKIVERFGGQFPKRYDDILSLSGIGKYTASAIASICFKERKAAVDGNFYRVLSRLFGDGYDISQSGAFDYFSGLAYRIMPEGKAGEFNQAMMDLGSEICKPRNPSCDLCPLNKKCIAYASVKVHEFPVKTKKTKVTSQNLTYYYIMYQHCFLIRQRKEDDIWKKLFEFPTDIPKGFQDLVVSHKSISHKLSHRNLQIDIYKVELNSEEEFLDFAKEGGFTAIDLKGSNQKSFPKPLENYLELQS